MSHKAPEPYALESNRDAAPSSKLDVQAEQPAADPGAVAALGGRRAAERDRARAAERGPHVEVERA